LQNLMHTKNVGLHI